MSYLWTILGFTLFVLAAAASSCISGKYLPDSETELRTKLLTKYDSAVRPSLLTVVYVDFVIMSLNGLNIDKQDMSVSGVVNLVWNDYRLKWNPRDHCNITSFMLDWKTVWQPTLIVENSMDSVKPIGMDEMAPLRVYATGRVNSMVPVNIRVFCEMRIMVFPFDTQVCSVNLFAWGYDLKEMLLYHDRREVITQYYSENGEWDLVNSTKFSVNLEAEPEIYTKLVIQFTFRRKWIFLFLTMIVPAVLNSLLMSAVFALPFESGEKIGYSLTVLLTYIVLLTLVTDSLPPISTDTSILQIYLTSVMCTGTIATLLTLWTVTMYNQDPAKPRPAWVICLCNRFIRPLVYSSRRKRSKYPNNKSSGKSNNSTDDVHGYVNQRKTSGVETETSTSARHGQFQSKSSIPPALAEDFPSNGMNANSRHSQESCTASGTLVASTISNSDNCNDSADLPENFCLDKGHIYPGNANVSDTEINHKYDPRLNLDESVPKSQEDDKGGFFPTGDPDPQRERLCSHDGDDPSENFDADDISWVQVANMMDALFLRIISSVIIAGTLGLIIYFSIAYDS